MSLFILIENIGVITPSLLLVNNWGSDWGKLSFELSFNVSIINAIYDVSVGLLSSKKWNSSHH